GEMPDSALIRIPMAYGMPCETVRFAWRNDRFVSPVFQPRRAGRTLQDRPSRRRLRREVRGETWRLPKLRKGADKAMKSLAPVTLCAGLRRRAGQGLGSSRKSCLVFRGGSSGPFAEADPPRAFDRRAGRP